MLEILPLRQVPGNLLKMKDMIGKGRHPITDHERIDHRQVVRTDQPWTLVFLINKPDFGSDPLQIAGTIAHQADKEKTERRRCNNKDPPQNVLQIREQVDPSFHGRF